MELQNSLPVLRREVGGSFSFEIDSLLTFFRSAKLSTFSLSFVPRLT